MLTNAVFISVILLMILSLMRVNILFAIIISTLTAGLLSGQDLVETTTLMVSGMGGQSNTALSYILLGIFAVMVGMSGITTILVRKMLVLFKRRKTILVLTIAGIACLSQNIIPVHIAFIPILIPPLLHLFDQLKLDRRAVAIALTFGLKTPYIMIPVGFGLIFQSIIRDEMIANGINITLHEVTKAMLIPGAGMVIGLLVGVFISYRKEREVGSVLNSNPFVEKEEITWNMTHTLTVVSIVAALFVQIWTSSLVLGALAGIALMFVTRVVKSSEGDAIVEKGVSMMGMIAFTMLIASGYATVLKETGAVQELVELTTGIIGTSPLLLSFVMLIAGLVITMGIGSSFGTIPILSALYVPICVSAGLSPLATAALIGTAGALGDAGSPASDSTLGPTSGLNADGKHHHIWDTCVPTFLHFNVPLIIFGMLAVWVL